MREERVRELAAHMGDMCAQSNRFKSLVRIACLVELLVCPMRTDALTLSLPKDKPCNEGKTKHGRRINHLLIAPVGPCPFTLQRSKNKQNSLPPKISVYHVLGEKSNNIKFDCIKLISLYINYISLD